MANPEKPKKPIDYTPPFERWAEGRTGFTKRQLVELYVEAFNITTPEANKLRAEATKEEEKARAEAATRAAREAAVKKEAAKESLIVTRIPYPKWWKTLRTAKINLTSASTQTVVAGKSDSWIYIATIVLTVSGETNITLTFGSTGSSGPMKLGGIDEPRGMVIAMGESPAPCGPGGFSVQSDGAAVSVGGFCTYYTERDETLTI